MGWLHAIPEGDNAKSKLEEYGAESSACKMPSADPLIVNAFHLLGFNMNVGMGHFPLTWCEIDSFSNRQQTQLSEWESEQLIMMSREYCNWLFKAKDRNYPSPWDDEGYDPLIENRKRIEKQCAERRASRL